MGHNGTKASFLQNGALFLLWQAGSTEFLFLLNLEKLMWEQHFGHSLGLPYPPFHVTSPPEIFLFFLICDPTKFLINQIYKSALVYLFETELFQFDHLQVDLLCIFVSIKKANLSYSKSKLII